MPGTRPSQCISGRIPNRPGIRERPSDHSHREVEHKPRAGTHPPAPAPAPAPCSSPLSPSSWSSWSSCLWSSSSSSWSSSSWSSFSLGLGSAPHPIWPPPSARAGLALDTSSRFRSGQPVTKPHGRKAVRASAALRFSRPPDPLAPVLSLRAFAPTNPRRKRSCRHGLHSRRHHRADPLSPRPGRTRRRDRRPQPRQLVSEIQSLATRPLWREATWVFCDRCGTRSTPTSSTPTVTTTPTTATSTAPTAGKRSRNATTSQRHRPSDVADCSATCRES